MLASEEVLERLAQVGAVLTNTHVIYTSGRHGESYINKDAVYPHTKLTSELCFEIAKHFENSGAEVVVAPALGGVILSQWVAFHLSQLSGSEVLGVYSEKSASGQDFILARGYDRMVSKRRCLLLEDVLTTGGSIKKVVDLVRNLGGEVVGVGALCNRGDLQPESLGKVPQLFSLINVALSSWEADQCPLCAKGIPINREVGKGKAFK